MINDVLQGYDCLIHDSMVACLQQIGQLVDDFCEYLFIDAISTAKCNLGKTLDCLHFDAGLLSSGLEKQLFEQLLTLRLHLQL